MYQSLTESGRVGIDIPLDTDNENQFSLSRYVGTATLLGNTSKADLLALRVPVLLDVLLGALEDDTALLLVGLWQLAHRMTRLVHRNSGELVRQVRPERRLIQQHRQSLVELGMLCII